MLLLVLVVAQDTEKNLLENSELIETNEEQKTKKSTREEPTVLGFQKLKYDRKYMDMYNDEMIWSGNVYTDSESTNLDPKGSGSFDHVTYIDYEFFDKFIVDRWTSEWLAEDTTWVIAMSAPIKYDPKDHNHVYGLVARSIYILNDHFYQGNNKVRFGIVNFYEHELIKETLYGRGPCYWVIKDGFAYRNVGFLDAYH